jgi:cell fate regulator YaaT (PSP1 superfamily)
MIAPVQPAAPSLAAVLDDQFIAAYGKSGGLGCFTAPEGLELSRGDQVALQTPRGLEAGTILGGATIRQARLLGAQTSGAIVRRLSAADEARLEELRRRANEFFETSRAVVLTLARSVHLIDVEVLLDARQAIVHIAAPSDDGLEEIAGELGQRLGLSVHFENAASPLGARDEHSSGGCGKPDCGKKDGGGCTSCGAGGCGSCGNGPVDLRPYFAHLRARMEEQQSRTSLL